MGHMVNGLLLGYTQKLFGKRFFAVVTPLRGIRQKLRDLCYISFEDNVVDISFSGKFASLILFTEGMNGCGCSNRNYPVP